MTYEDTGEKGGECLRVSDKFQAWVKQLMSGKINTVLRGSIFLSDKICSGVITLLIISPLDTLLITDKWSTEITIIFIPKQCPGF